MAVTPSNDDNNDDEFGSDSKLPPRDLPHHPLDSCFKEKNTSIKLTPVFRTHQSQLTPIVFYMTWQLCDTIIQSYLDMKKEVHAKRPVLVSRGDCVAHCKEHHPSRS